MVCIALICLKIKQMKKLSDEHIEAVRNLIDLYRAVGSNNLKYLPVHLRSRLKFYLNGSGYFSSRTICYNILKIGNTSICSLCKTAGYTPPISSYASMCFNCIHSMATLEFLPFCTYNSNIYDLINATTKDELINACKARAEYLETLLIKYLSLIKDEESK